MKYEDNAQVYTFIMAHYNNTLFSNELSQQECCNILRRINVIMEMV
jgi:hypothetical protein